MQEDGGITGPVALSLYCQVESKEVSICGFCLLSTEARWLIVSLVHGFCANTPSIPDTAAALSFPPAVQGTGQSACL